MAKIKIWRWESIEVLQLKKIIVGFIVGFLIGSAFYLWAKTESESRDAESAVGYGYNNGTLVAIQVDSNGVVQIS